jgi:hypothetical protein
VHGRLDLRLRELSASSEVLCAGGASCTLAAAAAHAPTAITPSCGRWLLYDHAGTVRRDTPGEYHHGAASQAKWEGGAMIEQAASDTVAVIPIAWNAVVGPPGEQLRQVT